MSYIDFPVMNGNPRNSEGSFLNLPENELIFAYTAFQGERARDFTSANIHLIRSVDGGVTWSTPKTIVAADDYHAMNVMSVSLLHMQNGDIGLIYLVRMDWQNMYIVLQRSSDFGITWKTPITCSTRNGYFVINNDRATRLASGRIIIPAAEHKNQYDVAGKVLFAPAVTTFFYSDDDGETWLEAQDILSLDFKICRSGLQEPGIVELSPGHLYGWARTDLGRQYEFISHDNGVHRSQPTPSRFTSPLSPLSMKRLGDDRLIAIWNPIPHNNISIENKATGDRTPLVYAFSQDDGETWSTPVAIEDEPDHGYCYTAILPLDHSVLLAYCAGSAQDLGSCLNKLRIRLLTLEQTNTNEHVPHCMGIGF